MATCTAIESKPLKFLRSTDTDVANLALMAGIKTETNSHQTYNTAAADDTKCMDGNSYPILATGGSNITYGNYSANIFTTKAQYETALTDLGDQTIRAFRREWADGSTSDFLGRVSTVGENTGGDHMEYTLTITKTSIDTFTASA
jgi:hypothetical protein